MMATKLKPKMDDRHGIISASGFSCEAMSPDSSYQENFLDDKDLQDMTEGFQAWTKNPEARPHVQVVVSSASFSMLSAQGRDRGVSVLWETAPGPRCSSRSSSTSGCSTSGVRSPAPPAPAPPATAAARGRVIFVMSGREVVLGADCPGLAPPPRAAAAAPAASQTISATELNDQPSEDETAAGWRASSVLSADEGVGTSQESDLEQSFTRSHARRPAKENDDVDLSAITADVSFTGPDRVEPKTAHRMSPQEDVSLDRDLKDASQLQKATLPDAAINSVGKPAADGQVGLGTPVTGDHGTFGEGGDVLRDSTKLTECLVAGIASPEPISIQSAVESRDTVTDNTLSANVNIYEFQEGTCVTALDAAVPRDGLTDTKNKVDSLSLDKGRQEKATDDITAEETVKRGVVMGISTTVIAPDVPALCADEFFPADIDNAQAADSVSQKASETSDEYVESAVKTTILPGLSQATTVGVTAEVTTCQDDIDDSVESLSNITLDVATSVTRDVPDVNVERAEFGDMRGVFSLKTLAKAAAKDKQDHSVSEVAPQSAPDKIYGGAFGVDINVENKESILVVVDQERASADTIILTSNRFPADEIMSDSVKRPDDSQQCFSDALDNHEMPLGSSSTNAQVIYDADHSQNLEHCQEPTANQDEIIAGEVTSQQNEHTVPLCFEESVYPLENVSGEQVVPKYNAADAFTPLREQSVVQLSKQMTTTQSTEQAAKPLEDTDKPLSAEIRTQLEAGDMPCDEAVTSEHIDASEAMAQGEVKAAGMVTAKEAIAEVEYFHDAGGQENVEQSGDILKKEDVSEQPLSGEEQYESCITEEHDALITGDEPQPVSSMPMLDKSVDRRAHLGADIVDSHGFPTPMQQDTQIDSFTEKPTDGISELNTQLDNSLQEGAPGPWDCGHISTRISKQAEISTADENGQTREGPTPVSSESFVPQVYDDVTVLRDLRDADQLELPLCASSESNEEEKAGVTPSDAVESEVSATWTDDAPKYTHAVVQELAQDFMEEPRCLDHDTAGASKERIDENVGEEMHVDLERKEHVEALDPTGVGAFEDDADEASKVVVTESAEGLEEPESLGVLDEKGFGGPDEYVDKVTITEVEEVYEGDLAELTDDESMRAFKGSIAEGDNEEIKPFVIEPAEEFEEFELPADLDHENIGVYKEPAPGDAGDDGKIIITELTEELEEDEELDDVDHDSIERSKERAPANADKGREAFVTEPAFNTEEVELIDILDQEDIDITKHEITVGVDEGIETTFTEFADEFEEGEPLDIFDHESSGAFKDPRPDSVEGVLDQEYTQVFDDRVPENIDERVYMVSAELAEDLEKEESLDVMDQEQTNAFMPDDTEIVDQETDEDVTIFMDAEEGTLEGTMDEINLELDKEASLGSEIQSEEGIDLEVWKVQRGLGEFAELYENDMSLEVVESIEDPDGSLNSVEDEDFDDAMDKEVEEYMDAEDFDIAALLAELESGSEAERKLEHPDVYCITCKKPIPALDKLFGDHKQHRVTALKTAVRLIKAVLKENTKILMERSNDVVDLQKLLYEISDSLEENFCEQEQAMQEEFDTLMGVLADRHAELCAPLEEEKKTKLEALYEQLVPCRCSLETTRALIAEAQALDPVTDCRSFLTSAEDLKARLDLALTDWQGDNFKPSASAEFHNVVPDLSREKIILDDSSCASVPSPPKIQPQQAAVATSSSIIVQWTAGSDDIVDHYNIFYLAEDDFQCEDTDTVNVRQEAREDYCLIEDLEPNTFYVFWVSAVNTAGASPPSDCVTYCTAPEPPIILVEECTACMDAATIRWDAGNVSAVDSYALEHCMQAQGDVDDDSSESHITRCISGIRDCEWVVRLQPGQTYALYVRTVNSAGPSQRSEPVLIRTKGTQFLLRKESAHPSLIISQDGAVIEYDGREDEYLDPDPNRFSRCLAVLGELTPSRGRHYWEVSVGECEGYRIGVAYPDTPRDGLLGQNDSSWCMRLICTPARHKYEFLHASRTPDIRTTLVPARIGVLLDFDAGRLAFFNAEQGQLLFSFRQHLHGLLQPAFALDRPGMLILHTGLAPPTGLAYC